MTGISRDPEGARLARLEREEKAARETAQRRANMIDNTITVFNAAGIVLLAVGGWMLVNAGHGTVDGVPIANLNTMLLGQTLATIGGMFVVGAALIRTR